MEENLKRLFSLLEIDQNLVDGIIDWLDENDQEQPFGAESSQYLGLKPPVLCKNGPIDSVDELLLVKGITRKILYGDSEKPGLAQFITVVGDEEGRININTADEKTLSAVLNSESVASMIVDSRKDSPFKSEEDMTTRFPDLKLAEKFTTQGSYFLVTSTGGFMAEGVLSRTVTIKAMLKRVRSEESDETENQYMSIDTAYWKIER
jgi:type II secretory pathway component PulK